MVITLIYYVGLLLVFTHPANLIIRHSPKYTTTAIGGGFLSQIENHTLNTDVPPFRDGG
jgi:flagellar biosynthesis component FlhA